MRRAIVYYSLSGNTKEAAEYLGEKLGADVFRIELCKPMPTDFKKQMLIGGMQATFHMTPKIVGVPENIATYDELIVGGPIWAGRIASPIHTFLKKYHVAEKVAFVFTYSGGGDNDKCISSLEKLLPNMRETVALADRNYKTASENSGKLSAFAEVIG